MQNRRTSSRQTAISNSGKFRVKRLLTNPNPRGAQGPFNPCSLFFHSPRNQGSAELQIRSSFFGTLLFHTSKKLCTMATLSTQLENLCRRIHIIGDKFRSTKLRPTQAQTKVYHELASTLTQLTGELSDAIVAATPENPSQERGRELVMHARLNDILNKTILKRNLVLIFKGPEESALDSDQVKARKRVTQQRCVQILNLRPEAIFLWANSFAPSLWAPGALSQDIFGYLVEELKSDASGRLPLEACSVLRTLGAEEPLSAHPMYEEMVKGRALFCYHEQSTDGVVALVERATSLSLDDHPERRCQVEAIMTKRQLNGIPPDTNESAAVDASTRR